MSIESLMRRAIELGKKAATIAADNPNVGCVIWRDGSVLGEGATAAPGGPHAEVAAWLSAKMQGHDVRGADLITTVEPCSFHGRTPACASAIVEWGIGRVIIGIRDPHPRVNGAGLLILRDAGIDIIEGCCAEDVRRYLEPWLRRHQS